MPGCIISQDPNLHAKWPFPSSSSPQINTQHTAPFPKTEEAGCTLGRWTNAQLPQDGLIGVQSRESTQGFLAPRMEFKFL